MYRLLVCIVPLRRPVVDVNKRRVDAVDGNGLVVMYS